MKRTVFLIVPVLLLAGSLLFAGGAKEETTTEGGEGNGPVTIVWWHSNSGTAQQATDDLVNSFNETVGKEKGITVEAVYQGSASDVYTKARALWQNEGYADLPDIAQFDAQATLEVRENPHLIPMQKLAEDHGWDLSQLVPIARNSQNYKGVMIGMPFNASTIALFYNKTAFDEAGIASPPRTIDEMAEDAAKLLRKDSRGNVTRYGVADVPTSYELSNWIAQQNHGTGLLVNANNGHDGIATRVVFDENGTMTNFLTHWKKLWDTGALSPSPSGFNSAFVSGKAAMIVQSSSELSSILAQVDGRFEVGLAPLPMVDENADGGVNVGGGALYALDNGKNHSDAIWTFVAYAVSPEQQLLWHEKTGYLPVNEGTYNLDDYKAWIAENPIFKVGIDQMRASNPGMLGFTVPYSYEIYFAFQKGIVAALQEGKSPEETTEALAKEINGYLSGYSSTQK